MRPAVARHMQALDSFIAQYLTLSNFNEVLNAPFVRFLCTQVEPILNAEPNILKLTGPINICGDLHGQLDDLRAIFTRGGQVPATKYLFLGDYVDRGRKSLEVICLLFALKIKYPNDIFLLRGNHEDSDMFKLYGFGKELKKKLDKSFIKVFNRTFQNLPLCAIINNKVFCVHGGISPSASDISVINEIDRFKNIPDSGLFSDLLWSDPSASIETWGPSERGETFVYGLDPLNDFLDKNDFELLIRGHQVCEEGFDYPFLPRKNVITIFSASSYDEASENKAAYLTVLPYGAGVNITQLPYSPPPKRGKRTKGDFILATKKAMRPKKGKKKKTITPSV